MRNTKHRKASQGMRCLVLTLILALLCPAGVLAVGDQDKAVSQNLGLTTKDITSEVNGLETWVKNYVKSVFDDAEAGESVSPSDYEWPTIGLARLGNDDGLDNYLAETKNYLADSENWAGLKRGVKVTEFERLSLAVGAAKGDPRDFAGRNLIAEIYNFPAVTYADYPEFAQGTNGAIFALIALDSLNYEIPQDAVWSREKIITAILKNQLTDGGFTLSKSTSGAAATSDPDLTAMAIQALAPYKDDATKPEVKSALDKAVAYLAASQQANGEYNAYGSMSSESISQVIIALCSVGIDIDTDPRFIKATNSLLSNLLTFRSEDGGFKHVLEGSSNSIASEQALLALASYVRFKTNQRTLYDYRPESATGAADDTTSEGVQDRLAGADRYATAVEIAKNHFSTGADTVVLARGDVSADALPAVPLAKKYKAPLLLTPFAALPDAVLTEIKALGAKTVVITGGEGAISKQVADTLSQAGLKVQRVFGEDHYGTAYEIAKILGNTEQAALVSGNYTHNFQDALSISSWAAYNGVPILYADASDSLPQATKQAITELGTKHTLLIGGTAVLPQTLETILPDPQRYSGQDLYETNIEVLSKLQPNPVAVYATTSSDFANALVISAVAGQSNDWVLLTGATQNTASGLTDEQQQLLKSKKAGILSFQVVGDTTVVPDKVLTTLRQILGK